MNYKISILAISFIVLFSGCSNQEKITEDKVVKNPFETAKKTVAKTVEEKVLEKKVYTMNEIYNTMCIECHSANGSGNTEKLTPSMAMSTEAEMIAALIEVEEDKGHVVMEHNRGKIVKMGMEYKAQEMAKYMFNRFNQ